MNRGRTYAAFTDEENALVQSLDGKEEVLDPMSGYGLVTQYAAAAGLKSYCVEYNAPQYLWQVLSHPRLSIAVSDLIDLLETHVRYGVNLAPRSRSQVSDDWFEPHGLGVLESLLAVATEAQVESRRSRAAARTLALAAVLPFASRMACATAGGVSTRIKQGGMCVLRGWEDDFSLYASAVRQHVDRVQAASVVRQHTLVLGDARTVKLPKRRFSAMITSPPYPNRHDFTTMFALEHDFLSRVDFAQPSSESREPIIGTNFVKTRMRKVPTIRAASDFLESVDSLRKSTVAMNHDRTYYLPYFANYFADLERAYENVMPSIAAPFHGFVTVVNNTHRGVVVPVFEVVRDIWRRAGYSAEIALAAETSHVGARNPRARGVRAKHVRYIIAIEK